MASKMEDPGIEMTHRHTKGRTSYSVDERNSDSPSPDHGGTDVGDNRDMTAMGKKQQMNV